MAHESLELGDHICVPAERYLSLDQIGGGLESLLAKTGLVGRGVGAVAPAFGSRPVPGAERFAKHARSGFDGARPERVSAVSGGIGEAVQVDVVTGHMQAVAAGHLHHQVTVTERAPQPRHQRLQGVRRIERRCFAPQRIDQGGLRDRSRDVDREANQQAAQSSTRKLDGTLVAGFTCTYVEGPEQIDPHPFTIAACATARPCAGGAGRLAVDKVVSDH